MVGTMHVWRLFYGRHSWRTQIFVRFLGFIGQLLSHRVLKTVYIMGKKKKTLEDLKKDLNTLPKKDLKKIQGGKKGRNWNNGCGRIIPQ